MNYYEHFEVVNSASPLDTPINTATATQPNTATATQPNTATAMPHPNVLPPPSATPSQITTHQPTPIQQPQIKHPLIDIECLKNQLSNYATLNSSITIDDKDVIIEMDKCFSKGLVTPPINPVSSTTTASTTARMKFRRCVPLSKWTSRA